MDRTTKTLRLYTALRDEIVAHGPNSRRRVTRQLLNVAMLGYKLQKDYCEAKAKNPEIYVKWLEPAKAFTAAQSRNLEKAKVVNKEIGKLLANSAGRRRKVRA